MKQGLVKCHFDKREKVTLDDKKLSEERRWLHKVLNASGYPKCFISRAITITKSSNVKQKDWEPKITITIPCVAGIREEIWRIYNTSHITVAIRTIRTIRSEFKWVKELLPLEKQSILVYRVSCTSGQAYIGKSIWRLESRAKEHEDAWNQGELEEFAIAEHAWRHDVVTRLMSYYDQWANYALKWSWTRSNKGCRNPVLWI